jgi:alanine racemase
MDMLAVDLTHLPDSGIGSRVVLWGEDVPMETIATAANTVAYELMCGVTLRVPKIYLN